MKCKSQALEQLIDYLINCINQNIQIDGIFLLGKCDGMKKYVCNKTFAVIRRYINQHIKDKQCICNFCDERIVYNINVAKHKKVYTCLNLWLLKNAIVISVNELVVS